jgi:hypothetical protein
MPAPRLRDVLSIPVLALRRLIGRLSLRVDLVEPPPGTVTLIADAGNHRVIEVGAGGAILWQYGSTGVPGSGVNQLHSPRDAKRLAAGTTLIADAGNNRVIEVARDGTQVWSYTDVREPRSAYRLPNGHTLIADTGGNRVIEVNAIGAIQWSYGWTAGELRRPRHAERLPNGNTVITDEANKVLEVSATGSIVSQRTMSVVVNSATRLDTGNTLMALEGSFLSFGVLEFEPDWDWPWWYMSLITSDAKRLANGNTLISLPSTSQVIEVDPDRNIVWQYGTENSPGSGPNQLRDPWEASRLTVSAASQPDLTIRSLTSGAETGATLFGTDGLNQSVGPEVYLDPETELRYLVRVTNTGAAATFVISATEAATPVPPTADVDGWRVTFTDASGADVTQAILGSGWQTAALPNGASADLTCVVRNLTRGSGEVIRVVITATPLGHTEPRDAVRIVAQASRLL